MAIMGSETKADLLDGLIRSIRSDPHSWQWGRVNTYISHPSGVEIWTYMGSANVYRPHEIKFSRFGKMRLRSAFRYWREVHGAHEARVSDVANCVMVLRQLRSVA